MGTTSLHEYKIRIERNDVDRKAVRWQLTLSRQGEIITNGCGSHNSLNALLERASRTILRTEEEEAQ